MCVFLNLLTGSAWILSKRIPNMPQFWRKGAVVVIHVSKNGEIWKWHKSLIASHFNISVGSTMTSPCPQFRWLLSGLKGSPRRKRWMSLYWNTSVSFGKQECYVKWNLTWWLCMLLSNQPHLQWEFCTLFYFQALAEQQKAQQLAQQQQGGAPQVQAAPGQAQAPAAGQAQAQVPQAAVAAGSATMPNTAVLVRQCLHIFTHSSGAWELFSTKSMSQSDFGLFGVVVPFQSCWRWHNMQTHLFFTMVIRNSNSCSTRK